MSSPLYWVSLATALRKTAKNEQHLAAQRHGRLPFCAGTLCSALCAWDQTEGGTGAPIGLTGGLIAAREVLFDGATEKRALASRARTAVRRPSGQKKRKQESNFEQCQIGKGVVRAVEAARKQPTLSTVKS